MHMGGNKMGLWTSLCLLHCGLAAFFDITTRYQLVEKTQSNPGKTWLMGYTGGTTTDWFIHSWIMVESTAAGELKLLGLESSGVESLYVI